MRHQPEYDEQIIELRKQCLTIAEIALKVGVSAGTVCKRLKAHGMDGNYCFNSKMYETNDSRKPYKKHREITKKREQLGKKRPFSLRIIGNNEVIHVLPTSGLQFVRLLKLLKKEGGEVI